MKKTKIIAAALIGVMSLTAAPAVIPEITVISSAASKLAAPENFKAANKSASAIKLTWSAVKGADAYRVFKFDPDTDEYEPYKNVTATSCTVKGLNAATTYKFKVAALVEKNGKYSVQTKSQKISVKTASSSSSKLSAPNIKKTVHATYVEFDWEKVSGAAGYRLYVYNPQTDSYDLFEKLITGNGYDVIGLYPEDSYIFKFVTLKKSGSSYIEQGSKVVKVTAAKFVPRTKAIEFTPPMPGDTTDYVLETCGIANYSTDIQLSGENDEYYDMLVYGEVLYGGVSSLLNLHFNEDGQCTGFNILIPCSEKYFYSNVLEMGQHYGEPASFKDDDGNQGYSWMNKSSGIWLTVTYFPDSSPAYMSYRMMYMDYLG